MCVRFDSEQNLSQEEVQREKNIREMLSREKDMLTGEVFSLRQQLEVLYKHQHYWPTTSVCVCQKWVQIVFVIFQVL